MGLLPIQTDSPGANGLCVSSEGTFAVSEERASSRVMTEAHMGEWDNDRLQEALRSLADSGGQYMESRPIARGREMKKCIVVAVPSAPQAEGFRVGQLVLADTTGCYETALLERLQAGVCGIVGNDVMVPVASQRLMFVEHDMIETDCEDQETEIMERAQ